MATQGSEQSCSEQSSSEQSCGPEQFICDYEEPLNNVGINQEMTKSLGI